MRVSKTHDVHEIYYDTKFQGPMLFKWHSHLTSSHSHHAGITDNRKLTLYLFHLKY